jgi:predicted RNase H-like HicB family nuclease
MLSSFSHIRLRILASLCSVALTVLAVGCGKNAPDDQRPPVSIDELEGTHSGHAHAETYAEAVAELEEMNKTIAAAFAANDIDSADEPIHEVGHVLDEVVTLAKKETLPEDAIAAISGAVEKLFDAFGRVDEKIHGGEGATYGEVQSDIDAGFEVLRQYLPK